MTRDDVMMRITRAQVTADRATLRLEGSIAAEWADLLERECSGLLNAGVSVTLDLAGVGFVDRLGVETLRRLGRRGVDIRCRCGAVASVLEAEGVRITVIPGGGPGSDGLQDDALDGDPPEREVVRQPK